MRNSETRFRSAAPLLLTVMLLLAAVLPAAAQGAGRPEVVVDDQPLRDGRVTIDSVTSDGPGWLVIHTAADGQPGPVIGYSPVRDGENRGVEVSIDAARATGSLIAMLHTDAGQPGVYEFPGPDRPAAAGGAVVMTQFRVDGPEAAASAVRIDLKARRFEFSPGVIRVRAGAPVELHIVSEDTTHGFAIRELGIDRQLEPGRETVVRFTAPRAGRYAFHCSVYCGPGHRDMEGELVVE